MSTPLLALLDQLAAQPITDDSWQGWRIRRMAGGRNNLLYRATQAEQDLAIKFTIRDARDRAGREFATLQALKMLNLQLAPQPLWLDRERYAQPVVVQSWVTGEVTDAPPQNDAEWQRLVEHYVAIHAVTPTRVSVGLPPAVLGMRSAADGLEHIRQQLTVIPEAAWPRAAHLLFQRLTRYRFPTWPDPPISLCRCDPNPSNFVRGARHWFSVDWENSGWGDAAFEIADLMAHPAYQMVTAERWEWVLDTYQKSCPHDRLQVRVSAYYLLMLGWWVARLARSLYEIPRGGDQRLMTRSDGWQAQTERQYQRYLELASHALEL